MLLRFNVSNFLSFKEEIEFSMYPGNERCFSDRMLEFQNFKVLKFSAIYGANASGKSNLIKSIDFAKDIIIKGISNVKLCEKGTFLIDNIDEGSKFEFEIKINNSIYAYGFILDLKALEVKGEWLYEICQDGENLIFERDLEHEIIKNNISFSDEKNKLRFEIYAEDSLNMKRSLLLSEIVRKKIKENDFNVFTEIYNWFKFKLTIIYPHTTLGMFSIYNNRNSDDFLKLLKYFDTGIVSFYKEKVEFEEIQKVVGKKRIEKFLKNLKDLKIKEPYGMIKTLKTLYEFQDHEDFLEVNRLLFVHDNDNLKKFELCDESDGTQRLIELLDIINNDDREKVFIIDELDRSFHPTITKKFVETFFRSSNSNEGQLIITIHESSLLDLNLIRKDEIWFIEKDNDLISRLYSLDNFIIDKNTSLVKEYLCGRYGAVPVFKDYNSYIGGKHERS